MAKAALLSEQLSVNRKNDGGIAECEMFGCGQN